MLEAALDTVRAAAEAKGVTLVADFGRQPEQALGDSTRLQQVVWNLLTNAVKFTPEGGRVELRMEDADDNVRITVSDTGRGIEPEFLPLVFVVDDQEDARELLFQALSEYGAQVTAVSSGVEALAFLSNPPDGKRPDALILDIAMPDEDGYTVLKKVRALEAAQGVADQIPAIALTAHGRSEDRLRALHAGFHMHVAKPVEPAELAVVIASMTTRRAWERKRKD